MPPKRYFTETVVYKLIKEVKERPCIWDTHHGEYNDRFHLAVAWKEVSDKLNLPDDWVRIKWKNLRDTFRREAKKSQSAENYTGKWQYFKPLLFLHHGETATDEIESDKELQSDQIFEDQEEVETFVKNEIEEMPVIEYLEEFEESDEPIPKKKRRTINDDEYDLMFLKSLAPFFRDIEPVRKLVLRSKIQDMLLNEIAAQTSSRNLRDT